MKACLYLLSERGGGSFCLHPDERESQGAESSKFKYLK